MTPMTPDLADLAYPEADNVTPAATPKKPAAKRAYTVLKRVETTDRPLPAGQTEWLEIDECHASTEQQALALAIDAEPENDRGGTYAAIARFVPRTVEVVAVQAAKLVWS